PDEARNHCAGRGQQGAIAHVHRLRRARSRRRPPDGRFYRPIQCACRQALRSAVAAGFPRHGCGPPRRKFFSTPVEIVLAWRSRVAPSMVRFATDCHGVSVSNDLTASITQLLTVHATQPVASALAHSVSPFLLAISAIEMWS